MTLQDRSALVVPLPGLAVLELRRGVQHEPFEPGHMETVNAALVWFNIAISRLQVPQEGRRGGGADGDGGGTLSPVEAAATSRHG